MSIVRVHRNLRTGRWVVSVKGKKVGDYRTVVLTDVRRFIVSEKRRQAVLAKQCREVHAWCEGELVSTDADVKVPGDARRGTYNPYRAGTFTDCATGEAITACSNAWFIPEGMFVL